MSETFNKYVQSKSFRMSVITPGMLVGFACERIMLCRCILGFSGGVNRHAVLSHAVKFTVLSPPTCVGLSSSESPASSSSALSVKSSSN